MIQALPADGLVTGRGGHFPVRVRLPVEPFPARLESGRWSESEPDLAAAEVRPSVVSNTLDSVVSVDRSRFSHSPSADTESDRTAENATTEDGPNAGYSQSNHDCPNEATADDPDPTPAEHLPRRNTGRELGRLARSHHHPLSQVRSTSTRKSTITVTERPPPGHPVATSASRPPSEPGRRFLTGSSRGWCST